MKNKSIIDLVRNRLPGYEWEGDPYIAETLLYHNGEELNFIVESWLGDFHISISQDHNTIVWYNSWALDATLASIEDEFRKLEAFMASNLKNSVQHD